MLNYNKYALCDSLQITNTTNGHTYQRIDNVQSWESAQSYCALNGGYLASIRSSEEDNFVRSNFYYNAYGSNMWLGGSDTQTEGMWQWTSGEPWEYSNWHPNEPNNGTSENCLAYWGDFGGMWNNVRCDVEYNFVCEWDGDPDPLLSSFDLNSSGINYTDKSMTIKFKKPTTFPNELIYTFTAGNHKEESSYPAETGISQIKWQLDDEFLDKTITVYFKTFIGTDWRYATLNITYDQITALAPEATISSRTLHETKIDLKDPLNNSYNYFENQDYLCSISRYDDRYRLQVGTATTHRIIDFDKIINKKINTKWQQTEYASKIRNYTDNRIPILLIHGWQGSNTDFQDRQQSSLLLWSNSELEYWQHFLDYYLISQKLQDKFHIYLYHYPTYKHVSFNAKTLNELLSESSKLNNDLSHGINNNNLVIIGHSMGGLVGRDLIEEQGFENYTKLIALDTPHHGSPASDDDGIGTLVKDLGTQGAADLNWDNVDRTDSDNDIDSNNANNRWKHINAKDFDTIYWDKLQTLVGSADIDNQHSKNPWLRWLNVQFSKNYSKFSSKYIFYVAALSTPEGGVARNDIREAIFNGFDFWAVNSNLSAKGYTNGGAEPTGSSFFCAFNKTDYPEQALADYFNPSSGFKFTPLINTIIQSNKNLSIFADTSLNIQYIFSTGEEHPYHIPYRLFFDYDHEAMANGAYGGQRGSWNNFIFEKPLLDRDVDLYNVDLNSYESRFEYKPGTETNNQPYFDYIRSAYICAEGIELSPALNFNPLYFEPLFLILKTDLLNIPFTSAKTKIVAPAINILLQ